MKKMVLNMVLLAMISAPALGCGAAGEARPAEPAHPATGEVPPTGEVPLLLPEECAAKGGETIGDPGDGSTQRNGCPGGRKLLGNVKTGIEGGICCAR
jgi:hypothetical protein